MNCSRYYIFFATLLLAVPHSALADDQMGQTLFDTQIAPLLAERCLDCHSGSEPKGALDLSTQQSALQGGDSGAAIVPGSLENSPLWQRVDADEMPPEHPLAENEKQSLREWIEGGAAWGQNPIERFRYSTARRAGLDWWSLQKVQRPPLPSIQQHDWPINPIDYFILSRLEAEGFAPSNDATRRVLVRRLYFDLLGLPPTVDEVQQFENDTSANAYEKLVDRVLASPHYGERWARHWLDVVRYGESDGFERNVGRPHSWPYRDWVIKAFNRDMPYDQFVEWQLAGDVLQRGKTSEADAIRATGFLVAGLHNTVVANNEVAKRVARHEELEELIGTVSQALLGLTVQCARCHDHKFDPISQHDYYRFVAILDGVQHGDREAESRLEKRKRKRQLAAVRRELQTVNQNILELESLGRSRVREQRGGNASEVSLSVAPIARWSFEEDARDSIGNLHGQLQGGAFIANGCLHVNGLDACVMTGPLDRDLKEKTLEAWVRLHDLHQQGGGVITVESNDGSVFDAIVYGERQARRWMAGSEGFVRTRLLDAPDETTEGDLVHVAISYSSDGSITIFRNGRVLGAAYRPDAASPITFSNQASRVLLGKRHSGGGKPWLSGQIEEARVYSQALSADEVQASYAAGPNVNVITVEDALAALDDDQRTQHRRLAERQQTLTATSKELLDPARVYAVIPATPPPTHLLRRGDVNLPDEQIMPSGLKALPSEIGFELPADAAEEERRRALAQWVTHPENPLFARVMVNRLWHYHFGRGLVETPSDFGFNGGTPSHPELLDYLAFEFIHGDFQLKAIHRLIVTSHTYRQSAIQRQNVAQQDADNRWLWRKAPQRLDAEALRDSMLSVAGLLNTKMGGPGFRDVREYFNSGTTYFEPLEVHQPEFFRRTIYRFSPRGERSALLDTFDCPDPSVPTPRRQVTTTPLQSLALLNDAFTLHVARQLADRVRTDVEVSENQYREQVIRLYELALQRQPSPKELAAAVGLTEQHGLELLCRAIINTHEFVFIE